MKLDKTLSLGLATALSLSLYTEGQSSLQESRHEVSSVIAPSASASALPKKTPPPEPEDSIRAEPEKPVCTPTEVNLEGIKVIPREKWGAAPPDFEVLGHMDYCQNYPIQQITLHHTGDTVTTDADQEKGRLRGAQIYHQLNRKWGDLAYHYAVGPSGRIYEGRNPAFRGDSSTQYYPKQKDHNHTSQHHLLIVAIGNYDEQELTVATRLSISKLVAANLHHYNLKPDAVGTHKEVAYTGCPGKNFQDWFQLEGKGGIRWTYDRWPL